MIQSAIGTQLQESNIVSDRIRICAQLHEKVWARPMMTVDEEFGVSGRGLAKICQRLRRPEAQPRKSFRLGRGEFTVSAPPTSVQIARRLFLVVVSKKIEPQVLQSLRSGPYAVLGEPKRAERVLFDWSLIEQIADAVVEEEPKTMGSTMASDRSVVLGVCASDHQLLAYSS